jgi:hypothetical protein
MGDNSRLRNTSERFQKFRLIAVNVRLHVMETKFLEVREDN